MIIYVVLGWVRRGKTPTADLDPSRWRCMRSHDHLRGIGMSEAWKNPQRPTRSDPGGDACDHMIIWNDSCDEPGAGGVPPQMA